MPRAKTLSPRDASSTRAGHPGLGDCVVLEDERAQSSVELYPARGALVTRFCVRGRELLYLDEATLVDPAKNVRGGIPVLFPSPGKLAGDRWQRRGASGTLEQHGFARRLPWQTELRDGEARVDLSLAATPETLARYPWDFALTLSIGLEGATLTLDMRVLNRSDAAMPFALGYHPYFHVTDKTRVRIGTPATRAFDNVTGAVIPFTGFDFTARELDLHLIDHDRASCALELEDGARLELRTSPSFARWVVWTVAGKDYVCLEPWTSPGNALNTGEELLELQPGAAYDARVVIELLGA